MLRQERQHCRHSVCCGDLASSSFCLLLRARGVVVFLSFFMIIGLIIGIKETLRGDKGVERRMGDVRMGREGK